MILITALLLGGPIFCEGELPDSYSFHEFAQETINVTVCGVPQPTVSWKFNTSTFKNGSPEKINNYTFTYPMTLPPLTQEICGTNLTFKAEGYLGKKEERKSRIFLSNCKFIDLLFVLLAHNFL